VAITDAVVPVAGLGTRLLPATKSQPKEMLPVGAKPVVQHVVEELCSCGVDRILFVTGRRKGAIENHFDHDAELERALGERGNSHLLAKLEAEASGAQFLYTRQPRPRGLGDALLHAERFAGSDPFVVALGDTIIGRHRRATIVDRLRDAFERSGAACAVAVERVPRELAARYGIVAPRGEAPIGDGAASFELAGIVEKPSAAGAPSEFAVAARYVLGPAIFEALRTCPPDGDGELQLTDAIASLIAGGEKVVAVPLADDEPRHDIGGIDSYLATFVEFALTDPEHGERLRERARELLG
jgi:UTP--glucose-1-phosphate uridylyltransferase